MGAKFKLLTPGASNPKTAKLADQHKVHNAVLHLAPHTLSGYNVCPWASKGCSMACLNTAGRGGIFKQGETTNAIQQARIRRTRYFFSDRDGFMVDLVADILKLIDETPDGYTTAVRLNGTSDIKWEDVPAFQYRNIMELFSDVQFYDYTKYPISQRRNLPANYHLTFSLSEGNDQHALEALRQGHNVAVVVKDADATWSSYPVVNGDKHDYRFLDPRGGHVVALKAKGKARQDTSGFVRKMSDQLDYARDVKPTLALTRVS